MSSTHEQIVTAKPNTLEELKYIEIVVDKKTKRRKKKKKINPGR